MENKPTIMLVDDNDDWRLGVRAGLERGGFNVYDFPNGEQAIEFINHETVYPSYAFVDQRLTQRVRLLGDPAKYDGIETASILLQARPELLVVLFSVQPDISDEERRRAAELGVCRFVQKQTGFQIQEVIEELQELSELQDAVERLRDKGEQLVATLREVPVGALLVDRHWYGWAANMTWRRIEERLDPIQYPRHRLPESLYADSYRSSLVKVALAGREADGLSLCAAQPSVLKYVYTRALPLVSKNHQILAASVSSVEQTPSAVARMRLNDRLLLIAKAIQRAGFDRVRFYQPTKDGNHMIGLVEAGGGLAVNFEGYRVSLETNPHLWKAAQRAQPQITFLAELHADAPEKKEVGLSTDCIECPLADADKLIGWICIDREKNKVPIKDADLTIVVPYAEEALRAFRTAEGGPIPLTEDPGLSEVWDKIERCGGPEQAMKIVLLAARALTGCHSGLIRVVRNDRAVKVAEFGEFPRYRPTSLPLNGQVWAIRTIRTGQAFVVQDMDNPPPGFWDEFETWNDEARQAHTNVGSFAVFPLTLGDSFRTIGAMSVQAPNRNQFTPERRATLQRLANVAAMAWFDLTRVEDRAAGARREMAVATLHNLRQPTMALEGALRRITKRYMTGDLTAEYAHEAATDGTTYLRRIEAILDKVQKFVKSPNLEIRPVSLAALVRRCAGPWKSMSPGLHVQLNLDEAIEVFADEELLRQVLDELWENASAAVGQRGAVTVSVSRNPGDSGHLPTARIDFEDTGPGFLDSIKERAFEPVVSTKAQGTGLGLAFVKKIVEVHEGRVSLDDVDPSGAKIIIELPLSAGEKHG
jgi:signal transduction histidine kinase/CheY-like chemotaxis protein